MSIVLVRRFFLSAADRGNERQRVWHHYNHLALSAASQPLGPVLAWAILPSASIADARDERTGEPGREGWAKSWFYRRAAR